MRVPAGPSQPAFPCRADLRAAAVVLIGGGDVPDPGVQADLSYVTEPG